MFYRPPPSAFVDREDAKRGGIPNSVVTPRTKIKGFQIMTPAKVPLKASQTRQVSDSLPADEIKQIQLFFVDLN
jgi:hypothetical protein